MKTKEELNALKVEVKAVSGKLRALSDDELEQVIGGNDTEFDDSGYRVYEIIKKLLDTIEEVKEKAGK